MISDPRATGRPGPTLPATVVVDERLRTTSICLAVSFGSRHDPPRGGGLAHLLEHVLLSTPVDGTSSFSEYVERLGGQANAETSLEMMLFYAQVHPDDADQVARLLMRAVLEPELTQAGLDAERAVVLQELAAAEADPADAVQDAFLARLFPGHCLGRPVGGTPDSIATLSLDQLRDDHRDLFLASAMKLTAIGPRPIALTPPPTVPARLGSRERRSEPLPATTAEAAPSWPEDFSWVCIGARGPAADDPARHHFTVLAHLMGSSPSSLLYRKLRGQSGLAYAFQAWSRNYTEAGAWRAMIGTEPHNGPSVVEIVRSVLESLATRGPTDEDLVAARRQAQMSLQCDADSPLERLRTDGQYSRAGTVAWSLESELAALHTVTAAQVQRAAALVLADLVTVVRPEPS